MRRSQAPRLRRLTRRAFDDGAIAAIVTGRLNRSCRNTRDDRSRIVVIGGGQSALSVPYPDRDEALAYLRDYERRYAVTVQRPVRATGVRRTTGGLRVETNRCGSLARAVVSARGTWSAPNEPELAHQSGYCGRILYSARHRSPDELAGRHR